ncbi:MAG: S8 family serine peptidase [Bacteroidia bacterium]|nr:S8 family serine peptidase [Bacteroidia bacterium]
MKTKTTFLIKCLILVLAGFASRPLFSQDSIYWYVLGNQDVWSLQSDVFAFRCVEKEAYTGTYDEEVIIDMHHRSTHRDGIMEVYFSPTASEEDILDEIITIRNSSQYEREFPAVTKYPTLSYDDGKWVIVDDVLFVSFEDPDVSTSEISEFMDRYDLLSYYTPSNNLPERSSSEGSYFHMFQATIDLETFYNTPVDDAVEIQEEEEEFVRAVIPNLLIPDVGYPESSEPSNGEFNTTPSENCEVNDPLFDEQWAIENDGSFTLQNGINGSVSALSGADAHICECWHEGLSGDGILIAVMADDDFFVSHTDISGQYELPGYDCSDSQVGCLTPGYYGASVEGSGTYIGGTIAAKQNSTGISGVAYNSKILPVLADFQDFSSVYEAFYRVSEYDIHYEGTIVDVLVTNFSTTQDYFPFEEAVKDISTLIGRPDQTFNPNTYYGITIIAPASAEENSAGTTTLHYPAAYNEYVLGVIGSTPEDELKTYLDDWTPTNAPSFGANYGTIYDVASPGTFITGLWKDGSSSTYESFQDPTWGSVVVAGGVAAMIVEDAPTLKASQIRNKIRNGADKVTYTYTNGVSEEFAHGRINCENSLEASIWNTSIGKKLLDWQGSVLLFESDESVLEIQFELPSSENRAKGFIYLINGQLIKEFTMKGEEGVIDISFGEFPNGTYLLRVIGEKGGIFSQKFSH